MEFGLSAEQALLQQSGSQFLERHAPLERVRQFVDGREQHARDVWTEFSDLGIPGILIDEQYGGVGLSLLDAALVAQMLGAHVAPLPMVSAIGMTPWAIQTAGSDAQKTHWLPQLASGAVVAGAALTPAPVSGLDASVRARGDKLSGRALFVLDFEAELYLVADNQRALYLVDADAAGLERRALTTIDGTRRLGELVFEDVVGDLLPLSSDASVHARVLDLGRILLAADILGAADTMLQHAVAYSKQRVQFGRVIGSFQAVKHLCAEMAAELEPCRAMLWYAAHAFDALPGEAALMACQTKAHLSEVGTFVAKTAIEIHGGVGFTDELGLHLWFKRIGANRQLLGGPTRLREEAAALQEIR